MPKSLLSIEQREGVRAVAPLAIAIGALGVVFGYIARDAGLSPAAAILMSATTFAGSPQFAAVSVFATGGSLVACAAAAAALSARFGAMSATASPTLGGSAAKRFIMGQLVVDETWAVAYTKGGGFDRQRLVAAGITLYVVHVSSTALGAGLGNFIGSAESWGLDVMSPALFVILMAPHVTSRTAWINLMISAVVTVAAIPITPPGIPIVLAIAVVIAMAAIRRSGPANDRPGRA